MLLLLSGWAYAAPTFETSPDGTRAITWNADDPTLEWKNVTLEPAGAVLEWRSQALAWAGGAAFAANGTLDSTLIPAELGIELRADSRNYVDAGDFSQPNPWKFTNGSDGETIAMWDALTESARIIHSSPAVLGVQWDSMDSIEANWTGAGSAFSTSKISQFPVGREGPGSGMMQDEISTGTASTSWAGASRSGPINWSAHDRLLLWILAPPQLPQGGASFNVSALVGTTTRYTTAIPLQADWTEVVVDLTELGQGRDSISMVTLRISGSSLDDTFYFDDLRLARAKGSSAPAGVSRDIMKVNETSTGPGTAVLSVAWAASDGANVEALEVAVNITGPVGTFEVVARSGVAGLDDLIEADVSSWMPSTGLYTLAVRVRFILDTPYDSQGKVYIDNVTLHFPGRTNGTFISDPFGFGGRVETVSLAWNASILPSGSARVALRGGDSPAPDGPWAPWWERSTPGESPYTSDARYFQIRAVLSTENASETPRLEAVRMSARHRAPEGTITTPLIEPVDDFARWLRIEPTGAAGLTGSFAFAFENGGVWTPVSPDSGFGSAPATIRVRVSLTTADPLETPSLSSFSLVYEVTRNPPPQIWDWLAGNPWFLAALVAAGGGVSVYSIAVRSLYRIEDVFLVARDGRLILHNTRRMRAEWDEDTFAGMLTAISAFVRDSFKEDRGHLNRFEFSGKTVLIERMDSMYVAAIYEGRVPRWAQRNLQDFTKDIEDCFGPRLSTWSGSPEDLQGLKDFTDHFVGKARYHFQGANRKAY